MFYISIFAYVSIIRYQQGKVKHIFEIFVTNYKRYLFNYYYGLAVFLADSSSIRVTTDIIRRYRKPIVNKLQDLLVGVPPDKRKPLPKQRFSTQSFLGLCYTIREFPCLLHSQLYRIVLPRNGYTCCYFTHNQDREFPIELTTFAVFIDTLLSKPFSHLLRWFFIAPYERTFQSETSKSVSKTSWSSL